MSNKNNKEFLNMIAKVIQESVEKAVKKQIEPVKKQIKQLQKESHKATVVSKKIKSKSKKITSINSCF